MSSLLIRATEPGGFGCCCMNSERDCGGIISKEMSWGWGRRKWLVVGEMRGTGLLVRAMLS